MQQKWIKVYLGVGANLGQREKNIEIALSCLEAAGEIEVVRISPLYETEPLGGPLQNKFLNAVICIKTSVSPQKLLLILKAIERQMGRRNNVIKWGPRIIDLDILFYGKSILSSRNLTIPHPLMHRRFFVLLPLCDIAPQLKHPIWHKTISWLLKELKIRDEKTLQNRKG